MAEGECFLFAHGIVFYLYRCFPVAHYLNDTCLVGRKLYEECRMILHSPHRSLFQGLGISFYREGEAYRGVVKRGGGVLHAVEIHAGLCIAQRGTLK